MTLLRAIALRVPGAAGGAPCSKPAYKERCCTRATRPSQRRSVGSASIGWVDQTLKLLVSDGFAKAASRSFACRMASTRAACRTCSLSSAFIEHQRYFVLLLRRRPRKIHHAVAPKYPVKDIICVTAVARKKSQFVRCGR